MGVTPFNKVGDSKCKLLNMPQVIIFTCENLEEAQDILCLCPLPKILSGWKGLSSLRCSKVSTKCPCHSCCVCLCMHRLGWRAIFGVTFNMFGKPCGGKYNENTWSQVCLASLRFRGALLQEDIWASKGADRQLVPLSSVRGAGDGVSCSEQAKMEYVYPWQWNEGKETSVFLRKVWGKSSLKEIYASLKQCHYFTITESQTILIWKGPKRILVTAEVVRQNGFTYRFTPTCWTQF